MRSTKGNEAGSEAPTPPADPELEDRRGSVRYSPDPLVPVFFAHPLATTPSAGLIADVSDTGVRIVAPPTARPMLHWGDPLRIIVTYSESARSAGIEGMRLWAHVIRLDVDSQGFRLHARFGRGGADGDWNRLSAWIAALSEE